MVIIITKSLQSTRPRKADNSGLPNKTPGFFFFDAMQGRMCRCRSRIKHETRHLTLLTGDLFTFKMPNHG